MLESIFLILKGIAEMFILSIVWLIGLLPNIFYSILSMKTGKIYNYNIYDYATMTFVLILVILILMLILFVFPDICKVIKIDLTTKTTMEEKRVMILVEKIYVPSSTRLIPGGNGTMIPIVSPSEFKVKLKGLDGYKIISNNFIYSNFKIGDSIDIILEVKKDKDNNVISENIIAFEY